MIWNTVSSSFKLRFCFLLLLLFISSMKNDSTIRGLLFYYFCFSSAVCRSRKTFLLRLYLQSFHAGSDARNFSVHFFFFRESPPPPRLLFLFFSLTSRILVIARIKKERLTTLSVSDGRAYMLIPNGL